MPTESVRLAGWLPARGTDGCAQIVCLSLPRMIGGMAATRAWTPERESGASSVRWRFLNSRGGCLRMIFFLVRKCLLPEAAADPYFTLSADRQLFFHRLESFLSETAPWARGPRDTQHLLKYCWRRRRPRAAVFERRSRSGGQSLIPVIGHARRLMCEVDPMRRSCKSLAKAVVDGERDDEAKQRRPPLRQLEMPVIMPIKACRRLARRYRVAIKSSKRMGNFGLPALGFQPSRIITTAIRRVRIQNTEAPRGLDCGGHRVSVTHLCHSPGYPW